MNPNMVTIKRDVLAARCQQLLNMSQAQWMEFQIDCGFDYLRNQMVVPEETVKMLTSGKGLFWSWWRNIWMEQDETFLAEVNWIINPTHEQVIELNNMYRRIHNVYDVRLFPSKTIFESYTKELV
jgi:hypothetical protein